MISHPISLIHVAGPTRPLVIEHMQFYERRCSRCGQLLDVGKISPLPRFEEGDVVFSVEEILPSSDIRRYVLAFVPSRIYNPEAYKAFKPCTPCDPSNSDPSVA